MHSIQRKSGGYFRCRYANADVLYRFNLLRLLFLFFLLQPYFSVHSQCVAPPAFPGCSPGGSVPLFDGAVISSGQTYTFSGTSVFNSITLNGGTLIICGNLTLNNLVVNSGTVYIQTGAQWVVYNGVAVVLGANTNIYNYGTVDFKVSIVTGANNTIMNCLPASQFLVAFDQFIVQGPNTRFVNNGSFQSSYFIVQSANSPAPVCLGNGSIIRTATLINQYANAFTVPVGAACLNVTSNVINSSAVTNTASLLVCLPASISIISGPNWGSASVSGSCVSCSVILLPVELTSFTGEALTGYNRLEWQTASEQNSCYFTLERAEDMEHFSTVAVTEGNGFSNELQVYQVTDSDVTPSHTYYYRLSETDCNGAVAYYTPLALTTPANAADMELWPNPVSGGFRISGVNGAIRSVTILNLLGQPVAAFTGNGCYDVSMLPAGMYTVRVCLDSGSWVNLKMIKE